jgi:hypothetical protein
MLWRALRLVAGLAIGVALWWSCGDAWNRALAVMARPLMKLDSRIAQTDLVAVGHTIVVQPLVASLPMATIPADQLTYNVILLVALFASNRAPFSDRNMKSFAIALAIVLLSHPIGLFVSIESTYAMQQGAWSDQHYGETAQRVWVNGEVFYRLIGMFGVVFAAWWLVAADVIKPASTRRRSS